METLNNYVLKAINAYPYDLEETVENLNYALSTEPQNSYALHLMGKIQSEHLGDFEKAKLYFAAALAAKLENQNVYPDYISVMIKNEDYLEAKELIDFSMSIKGIDKAKIWFLKSFLLESKGKYGKTIKALKKAQRFGYDTEFDDWVNAHINRVKAKMKDLKKESKTKKRKKINNNS